MTLPVSLSITLTMRETLLNLTSIRWRSIKGHEGLLTGSPLYSLTVGAVNNVFLSENRAKEERKGGKKKEKEKKRGEIKHRPKSSVLMLEP